MTPEREALAQRLLAAHDEAAAEVHVLNAIELHVLTLTAKGCTLTEIGALRGTSPRTVENQRGKAYRKLGLGMCESAVLLAKAGIA